MKVAMYDDRHFSLYGAQRVMISLGQHLHDLGHEPTILTGAPGPLSRFATEVGLPVQIVPIPPSLDIYSGKALQVSTLKKLGLAQHALAYSLRLHRAIERLDPDIIFANALRPLLYCAGARLLSKRRIVWFLQGGTRMGLLSILAAIIPHRIMGVSNGALTVLPGVSPWLFRRRAFVNPPGIDPQAYAKAADDVAARRARLGLPRDRFLVLAVGSIEHRKGFDVLLQAVEGARAYVPTLHLVIAGTARGEVAQLYEHELRRYACSNDIPVTFLGWIDDTANLMSLCDLFVLSSRLERFGLVTVEAMASSLPVIVSRAEGSEETVVDGESGIVVEPDNPAALAEKLVMLAKDAELRSSLATAGRVRVLQEYTMQRFVDRFVREAEMLNAS